MAEEKLGPETSVNFSSLGNIVKMIRAAFKKPEEPLTPLPPQLLLIGANQRPGLSPRGVASRIIARQSDAGAPVGNVFSQNGNISELMELIRIEEIISALQLHSKIEIVIPPGVQVTTVGVGNLGGPVISQGATTNIAIGTGVIR